MPYVIENFLHAPHTIPDATEVSSGTMSAADKIALDNAAGNGTIQRGNQAFAGESSILVILSVAVPAAKAAGAVILCQLRWPTNLPPASIPGIVNCNLTAVVDGGGNLAGFYIVPEVSGTYTVGWAVIA